MIWYLLYPFRGTTEPPILSSNHPIRLAFYRHGASAGRHWLTYILLSVTIAVLACYPVGFLYDKPATGVSKLPYHMWTSARRYHGNQSTPADIEIRQIWIHGSSMKALRHDVLNNALKLHVDLIGGANAKDVPMSKPDACQLYDGHPSRGLHSPLMYWNCSSTVINHDADLLETINRQTSRRSYLNLTLRPSSVFAGKSFLHNKLIAADALVVTLFDQSFSANSIWDKRLVDLVDRHSDTWAFYPSSGHAHLSHLYQFQFKPISIRDDILLFFAYSLMFLYVVVALKKTRAVKSQLGLIVAIITEMTVSVFASFTICGLLGIDLAVIPQEVYPFVVLVIGLEHMFRLINAVLVYPPQMAPTLRIANALGDVGHLALAASTQNLLFLWLLQKVVSPGVQSFCTFAAVALIFDFFFHLMFFVTVLHVDVRRMELQDSIGRTVVHSSLKKRSKVQRQFWFDAFLQGRTPFTTRIAGSVVSICFILFLNVHFSDSESIGRIVLRGLMSPLFQSNNSGQDNSLLFPSPPINSPRTPQSWLRLQDYQSAREFITYVKPQAHILIARIYEPLVLVLRGSDRTHVQLHENTFQLFWKLAQNHIYPFFLALISIVAIVFLLMQYLLWSEIPLSELEKPTTTKLYIHRIASIHSLDILKILATQRAHMVVLDLDRAVVLYTLDETHRAYNARIIQDAQGNNPLWSNERVKIDKSGCWLVFWDASGRFEIWNTRDMVMASTIRSTLDPVLVDFAMDSKSGEPDLVVLSSNGSLCFYDSGQGTSLGSSHIATASPIKNAVIGEIHGLLHLIASDTEGEVYLLPINSSPRSQMPSPGPSISESGLSRSIHQIDPRLAEVKYADRARKVAYYPALSIFTILRMNHVDLIQADTGLLIHRIQISKEHAPPSNLCLLFSPPKVCQLCQSPTVANFSIAYNVKNKKSCIVQAFARIPTAEEEADSKHVICLRPSSNEIDSGTCKGLFATTCTTTIIDNDAGCWDATHSQIVIGVRKKRSNSTDDGETQATTVKRLDPHDGFSTSVSLQKPRAPIKPSISLKSRHAGLGKKEELSWEIWSFDAVTGSMSVESLKSGSDASQSFYGEDLLVVEPGPIVALGKRSVVLAMGTSLRAITAGSDRVEAEDTETASQRAGSVTKLTIGSLDARRRRGVKNL